ncbi:nucleotide exchange factor GrpE [Cohaesibacter sp. CAU 1516]|uniref:nucleotide exchange factor GrpE n=1 Tax=Cohaesibacter sp. CAU 1516 TaxID=2576038 RepID=UPI0010FE6FB5|nr:nucleotide exchange factor GrpE [Cohaesibacter sp. CAU 1516]TLP47120.1 nucleotide exchange factor GrpE [Cohaesibacter sp. CAU 1516]
MSEEKQNSETVEDPLAEAPVEETATDAPYLNPLEAAELRIAELEKEHGEMKDQLLRTVAEMENLRRRTEKEVRDAKQFSVASFARDMLAVADNLRRGQEAVADEERVAAEGALKALLDGTAMTEREMLKTLEKHGVKKLNPEGEKFDPNYHQAMFEVPNPEVPNNSVVQVVQAGYVIGTRVLRPAMVGVAKGGPKFVSPAADEESTDDASGEGLDKSV